jgi:RNA polymerase sigma-70 factor (ECF subfamily)
VTLDLTANGSNSGDGDLLYRLQNRRPGAFEELLDLYQQPIHGFVYRLLEDPSEAPDVTQEVFIKVFCKVGDFRGDSSLKTWLYRIAVHEASNRRRWFSRHRRRETAILDSDDENSGWLSRYLVDQSDSPFEATYRQEQRALVEATLRGMDERLRTVVILRDIEGLAYSEISETLQVSLGTVKSRILRGREILQARLQQQVAATAPTGAALQTE